jgi:hypothetical protein
MPAEIPLHFEANARLPPDSADSDHLEFREQVLFGAMNKK